MQRQNGIKHAYIEILHKFTVDKQGLQASRSCIKWTDGSLTDRGMACLGDTINIIPADSPLLFSNWVRQALNDEHDLDIGPFKKHIRIQGDGTGGDLLTYLIKDRSNKIKKRKSITEDDGGTKIKTKKKRRSSSKRATRRTEEEDEDDDGDEVEDGAMEDEEEGPDEVLMKKSQQFEDDANSKIPNGKDFAKHLSRVLLAQDTPEEEALKLFKQLRDMDLISRIDVSFPKNAKEHGSDGTSRKPTIENWLYQERHYEPSSPIDLLVREHALKGKRGEQILEAKNFKIAEEMFNGLCTGRKASDIHHDEIEGLLPGCVSSILSVTVI